MWCGTRPVVAVLFVFAAAALFAMPAHTPVAERTHDAMASAAHPQSCKAVAPFTVQATPVAGSSQRWTLTLTNLDEDQDVEVWMGPDDISRRRVWQGRLQSGVETRVEVTYAAPAGAQRVVVALEPTGLVGAVVRGVDVIEIGARVAQAPDGRLVEDPTTGKRVRQFQGAVGGSR